MRFAPAPEYQVFPTRERPLKPYAAAARAAIETRPLVRELAPDVVVNDVLTLAPALAAELEGRPLRHAGPPLLSAARARPAAVRARRDAAARPRSGAPPGGRARAPDRTRASSAGGAS